MIELWIRGPNSNREYLSIIEQNGHRRPNL